MIKTILLPPWWKLAPNLSIPTVRLSKIKIQSAKYGLKDNVRYPFPTSNMPENSRKAFNLLEGSNWEIWSMLSH